MPGGRLTHEDRRRVAAWLGEGLGYAEIGRRLDRPTSTISREVARNVASGDYQPARAQHAAEQRARRRKPARPAPDSPGEIRAFVDEFAASLAATGLPRMTARVFVSLLTADAGGRTSADLVRGLQVSPASVSKSIAALEAIDLVVRHVDPGSRRERYMVDEDVWLRAWQTDTSAHGQVAATAERGVAIFGADSAAGIRLGRMGQFFARLSGHMSDSAFAEPAAADALTLLAALAHAARPLHRDALARALDWPPDRIIAAAAAIRRQPAIADPLALRVDSDQTYALAAGPDRLNRAQRAALIVTTVQK
ncbi:MAG TPA: helix-turn-helix domain-containing protein [Pseudonocardiaceae bacterium]|nr:helix-turn-helix domain-containing protein [Pseudonocardiaceae bacterium]